METTSRQGEAQRVRELRTMKRRATVVLGVVSAVFVVLLVAPRGDPRWLGYALAAAEGSMVGGLADWFAVTALFRHPLGLPIPHTAVISERKDQLGETNAKRVAAKLVEAAAAGAELVDDGDVQRLLHVEISRAVRSIPVDHELRHELDARPRTLAERLQHDPALAGRAEALVGEMLDSPDVGAWTRTMWRDLKASLHDQVEREDVADAPLRRRLANAVMAIGQRLGEDAALQQGSTGAIESSVRYVATHYRGEISSLISATIDRWDAEETSDKLELFLGRDLQFIRINGTVVGGLAGFALHGVVVLLR